MLVFIEQNLNNHFTLYKLKNSGLIEFLLLALNTRNGERALQLLLKIQEVCVTFNEGLDFTKFNSHDLQMIREDKEAIFAAQKEIPIVSEDDRGILGDLDMSAIEAEPKSRDAAS